MFPAATSPVPEKIYLQPETWHTVLVSSSISPGAPPSRHPCERNARGPRARLSSVESDLQGDPWHGSLRYPRGSAARCAGRDAMMAPPASTPRAGAVVPSVVCKHSNTHAPAARTIQPDTVRSVVWAGTERSRRKLSRGRGDGWAPRRPGMRPHPAIRPPEKAQIGAPGSDPYRGIPLADLGAARFPRRGGSTAWRRPTEAIDRSRRLRTDAARPEAWLGHLDGSKHAGQLSDSAKSPIAGRRARSSPDRSHDAPGATPNASELGIFYKL